MTVESLALLGPLLLLGMVAGLITLALLRSATMRFGEAMFWGGGLAVLTGGLTFMQVGADITSRTNIALALTVGLLVSITAILILDRVAPRSRLRRHVFDLLERADPDNPDVQEMADVRLDLTRLDDVRAARQKEPTQTGAIAQ